MPDQSPALGDHEFGTAYEPSASPTRAVEFALAGCCSVDTDSAFRHSSKAVEWPGRTGPDKE